MSEAQFMGEQINVEMFGRKEITEAEATQRAERIRQNTFAAIDEAEGTLSPEFLARVRKLVK